jgi:hypothetical protein
VVPHGFDLASSRYVSIAANLGTWTDPDGDPMFGVAADAPCDRISVVEGTVAVVCSAPYTGTPAVERIAGTHSVRVRVRDAWEEGGGVPQDVTVLNSTPSLSVTAEGTAQCWVAGNGGSANACGLPFVAAWGVNVAAVTFTARPAAFDPDGDPVAVLPQPYTGGSASPSSAVCTNGSCVPFQIYQPPLQYFCPMGGFADPPPTRLAATDGAAWAPEVRVMPALSGCPH